MDGHQNSGASGDFAELEARCAALERERARLIEHIRHTRRLDSLGVFAGAIAHDMNNFLSVIMGNADILALEATGEPLLNHCCGEIQKAASRASSLAAQMLAYSGGGKYVVDNLDLSRVVDELRGLMESTRPHGVRIELALATGLPEVSGDSEQLQHVLANLVAGASDALGGAPGTIRISTGLLDATEDYLATLHPEDFLSPGPCVYLEVRDNGPGLDQDVAEHFYELSRLPRLGDRGLALAASLGVVRAHHGAIRVLSLPGEGTAVRIHFPPIVDEIVTRPAETGRSESLLADRDGRARILLVDDEEMMRAIGETILEQNGYAVVLAKDGNEAVEAYITHGDDLALVLLDMSMPRRDGYEVARALRSIRADIPIVLCSGYAGVDARNRFAGVRFDGFLQKPYHMHELLDVVNGMIRRFGENDA